MQIEIIKGPETKGEGVVYIDGKGSFRPGDIVTGSREDLQPLVDLGRARVWVPGETEG